jgi:hypothetical protein
MATYPELYDLWSNSALLNKVTVACLVAAEAVRVEDPATPNHAVRLAWAKAVFTDPIPAGKQMFMAVLAGNAALTTAQILNAPDTAIQTKVSAAVPLFAEVE